MVVGGDMFPAPMGGVLQFFLPNFWLYFSLSCLAPETAHRKDLVNEEIPGQHVGRKKKDGECRRKKAKYPAVASSMLWSSHNVDDPTAFHPHSPAGSGNLPLFFYSSVSPCPSF
jgi:hypothetical protein